MAISEALEVKAGMKSEGSLSRSVPLGRVSPARLAEVLGVDKVEGARVGKRGIFYPNKWLNLDQVRNTLSISGDNGLIVEFRRKTARLEYNKGLGSSFASIVERRADGEVRACFTDKGSEMVIIGVDNNKKKA